MASRSESKSERKIRPSKASSSSKELVSGFFDHVPYKAIGQGIGLTVLGAFTYKACGWYFNTSGMDDIPVLKRQPEAFGKNRELMYLMRQLQDYESYDPAAYNQIFQSFDIIAFRNAKLKGDCVRSRIANMDISVVLNAQKTLIRKAVVAIRMKIPSHKFVHFENLHRRIEENVKCYSSNILNKLYG